MKTQKKYKDTVYRMLFGGKEEVLFYAAALLQAFVKDKSLYSARQIKLPTPHFVVFYNGMRSLPESMELKLSDAFESATDDSPSLELKVQVLNINPGNNEELKAKCPVLGEYVLYVEKVRSYVRTMPLEEAVEKAITDCISENILREFLSRQRAEVFKMSIYEYDEERELKLMLADERELGREEGIEQGIEKGIAAEKENTVRIVMSLSLEMGNTKEKTLELLKEKCCLSQQEAERMMEAFDGKP